MDYKDVIYCKCGRQLVVCDPEEVLDGEPCIVHTYEECCIKTLLNY